MTTHNLTVKSWKITDKYNCPECKSKLVYPKYFCKNCDLELKIKLTLN